MMKTLSGKDWGRLCLKWNMLREFDHILINDSLETAFAEAEKIVKDFLAL